MIYSIDIRVIGNAIAFVGMTLFVLSSVFNSKKKILITQSTSHVVNMASELCLGQYTAVVQEIIDFTRNLVAIRKTNNKILNIILIVLGVVVGVLVNVFINNNDPFGYLPIFASLEYSIVILMPKVKVWHIKCAMLVSTLCWAIYGLVYQNYVMLAFNILSFVITIITLIKIWKNKSNDASEN